jgi:hypothetical protein
MRTGSYVLQCSSRAEIVNKKQNVNANAISRPKCHVLSNGALVFAVSIIFCTGKLIKLFAETALACIQPPFSAYRTQITGNQIARFKRTLNGLEKTLEFTFILYLHMISPFE